MNAALRTLEAWTTHQDYLWFLAVLAWSGVLGGEWGRNRSRTDGAQRYWLMGLAVSGIAAALLELVLLAQDIKTPYTRADMAMGFAQAFGTSALIWGGTMIAADSGRSTMHAGMLSHATLSRAFGIAIVFGAAAARYWRPLEGGAVMCLVQAVAVVRLLRQSPRPVSPWAAAVLACVPVVATYGPLAYAIDHGRRALQAGRRRRTGG